MPRSCARRSTSVMSSGFITAPEGLLGRIQDDDLGVRRDRALHHVGGQREVVPLVGGDVDRLAAGIAHDVLERHPVGHRNDDFVAVIDQHLDGVEQRMLAADRGNAVLALVVGAEVGGVPLDDGIAQFGRAADRGVLGEVGADGRDARFFDVLRRGVSAALPRPDRPGPRRWRAAFRLLRPRPWWRKPRCVECGWSETKRAGFRQWSWSGPS